VLAFRSADLRGVIAYSSMAQMGLITMGSVRIRRPRIDGAVLQSVAHGLISASMFLLVGMVERAAAPASWTRSADGTRPTDAGDDRA
jgi:NADH:ubiquinone oxidoreductase subunit 4 (subunit M)